jgi:hypothetical protein
MQHPSTDKKATTSEQASACVSVLVFAAGNDHRHKNKIGLLKHVGFPLFAVAVFAFALGGCGRLGLTPPSVSSGASTTHASTTSTNSDSADGLGVGVKFRIDPYLVVAESDANSGTLALAPSRKPGMLQRIKKFFLETIFLKQKQPSLALTAGSVALVGIDHAIVNVLGCAATRYNRETELHQPDELPFVFHNFQVKIEPGINNASCYLSLDVLQIAFDQNTGTTITETYLRDVSLPGQSATDRDGGGELVFINRTSPASMVGPLKMYVNVSPIIDWLNNEAAISSSSITYTLKSFSAISNDRDLSTISAASAVITAQNSITIGQSVDMPLNLLTMGSIIPPPDITTAGSYGFELWCTKPLSSGNCGDVIGADSSSVFCAIPKTLFDPSNIDSQCPAAPPLTAGSSNAERRTLALFDASRVSINTNGILNVANFDNFFLNPFAADNPNEGFVFVVRTDISGGTGFKYWNITSIPSSVSFSLGAAALMSNASGQTIINYTIDLSPGLEPVIGGATHNIGGTLVTEGQQVQLNCTNGCASGIQLISSAVPNVSASIPDGTTIIGSSSWDGTLSPPAPGTTSGTPPSGFSVGSSSFDIGSASSILLFWNQPATILLTGVTGAVGYRPAGSTVWTAITTVCGGATLPASGAAYDSPASPVFPGECYVNNGTDTKIVTYHFTTFAALEPLPTSVGIYWINTGNNTLYVGEITPTNPQTPTSPTLLLTGGGITNPSGVFADSINHKIYWTNYSNSSLWVADLHPSDRYQPPTNQTQLTGGDNSGPMGVFVDASHGKIYRVHFTNSTLWVGDINPANPQAPTNQILLLSNNGLSGPVDVSVDTVNNKIYWANFNGNTFWVADINASNPSAATNPTQLIGDLGHGFPGAVFIDGANGKLYWGYYNPGIIYVGDINPSSPATPTNQTILYDNPAVINGLHGISFGP